MAAYETLGPLAQVAAVRGSLLFHLFLAEALASGALAGDLAGRADGWALDVGADGYELAVLELGRTVAQVTFAADGAPLVEARTGWGTPRQVALAEAKAGAVAFARGLPARHAALVVPPPQHGLEPPTTDGYLVRLPDRAGDIAIGPHWRLTLQAGRVAQSAAIMPTDEVLREPTRGDRLVLVHAEEPTPCEMHVFLSLNHGVGLDVATPASGLAWRVDGESIVAAG